MQTNAPLYLTLAYSLNSWASESAFVHDHWGNKSEFGLLVVTALLWIFTAALWGATRKMAKNTEAMTRTIERAYVKMSHVSPGLGPTGPLGPLTVQIKAENAGKTPADITDMVLDVLVLGATEPLPAKPPYRRTGEDVVNATLLAGDFFYVTRHFFFGVEGAPMTMGDYAGIIDGSRNAYLLGYVDYVDKFGVRHRSGYARRYQPKRDQDDKLVFVTAPHYNYDRERKKRDKRGLTGRTE